MFARDPDRLARFQRKAHVLASLNHPNIAAIHGLEESAGVRALVLELVEGPTLADRIAHGTIPLDEALPIAKQIAEALQVAHDHGVIHRDLKPSNIKLRVGQEPEWNRVPAKTRRLLQSCLQKDPKQRFEPRRGIVMPRGKTDNHVDPAGRNDADPHG